MIKLMRPGATETTVMLCQYFTQCGIKDDQLVNIENEFINWLYSAAGFYDKHISGKYFDINTEEVKQSSVYHHFIDMIKNSITNSTYWHIFYHEYFSADHFKNYIYKLAINKKVQCSTNLIDLSHERYNKYIHYWCMYDHVLPLLEGKRVFVVNPFLELMLHQFHNHNLFYIYPSMKKIENLLGITTPFTFFNDGPHDNYLQNIADIIDKIYIHLDYFDIAFIGCGPMGCILSDYIHQQNKEVVHMGSGIHKLFGIDAGGISRPYWITTLPKHLIPENAHKIENGRYWYGN